MGIRIASLPVHFLLTNREPKNGQTGSGQGNGFGCERYALYTAACSFFIVLGG